MGVCRYFLQGTCRFGDNCRYQHIETNYHPNAIQVRQQQPQLSRQQLQGQLGSNDFYDLVKDDLESAERSSQWVLSCYCPCPSKSAALPGLDDYSPEEIRCLVYQAQASGNVQPCIQLVQKLYQDAEGKRNIFKLQSPECKAILDRVLSGPASPASPASPSSVANPFLSGNSSGRSAFGVSNSVQPTSLFGGSTKSTPQASSAIFGGVTSVANPFGSGGNATPQPTSIFGGNSAAVSVNQLMGGSGGGQPSSFASPPLAASALGSTQAVGLQTQGSIFGGGNTAASVFGGQSSGIFQGAYPGGASQPINSFSFAAAAQSSQQLQGLIGSAPAATPASTPALAQQPFSTDPSPTAQSTTSNPFGPTNAPPSNPFGPTSTPLSQAVPHAVPDSGSHLALSELTEAEKAEFLAPIFSKGRIPVRPPPAQLCN